MPVIKRYPNRKLYDTEAKRYVTLDNITQMIQQGQEILVIDHETGEDLTNLTLSQIIFEQEKKGSGLMSRSLLTNLIRASGDTIDQMKRALMRGTEVGDVREVAAEKTAEPSPLQRVDEIFQDVLHTLNVPTNRELQQLQQQLDELNVKIGAILAQGSPVNTAPESSSEPPEPNDPP